MNRNEIAAVSVVIPCYRCADTVTRAVNSIVQQTQKPAEVILIDDASGDGTLVVLQALEKEYSGWIKVVALKENSGVASARNAGWTIATQPYIAFLDADDAWHPAKLAIQHEYMRQHPSVALCGHQCVEMKNDVIPPRLPAVLSSKDISATSLLFRNAFSTPTVMLKRELSFRFLAGKRCAEDFFLWQQIAFAGLQVVRLESPLAYVHKPLYGAGGLSAALWRMEKGELANFMYLYREKKIGLLLTFTSVLFSLLKYLKREVVSRYSRFSKLLMPLGVSL